MTRAVDVAPNAQWFALTSIEGRCAVVHFDDARQQQNDFNFKCHRMVTRRAAPSALAVCQRRRQGDDVFPVNDVSFRPNGVFLTVGNDASLTIWDKVRRAAGAGAALSRRCGDRRRVRGCAR